MSRYVIAAAVVLALIAALLFVPGLANGVLSGIGLR